MSTIKTYEGDFSVTNVRIAILAARFNEFIVNSLVSGAINALRRHGLAEQSIELIKVPGCYEIPLIAKRIAAKQQYAGIVAVGTVIRGATPHFDYVAGECAKGLSAVAMQYDIPIGFGVLTVDSIEQAIERAGTKAGNKGSDAAMTVLEMISLLQQLDT